MSESKSYTLPIFKVALLRDSELPGARMGEIQSARLLWQLMGDIPHEEMWAILVDAQARNIGAVKLAHGGSHGVGVLPKDIFRPLMVGNASGFVLGHNHPSGDPTPSSEDISFTRDLARLGKELGIPLLDHIVTTHNPDNFRSFYQLGIL